MAAGDVDRWWRRLTPALLGGAAVGTWCFVVAVRLLSADRARRQLRALLNRAAGEEARIIITGADCGIGKELAEQFAKHPSVSLLLGNLHCTEARYIGKRCRIFPLDLLDLDSVQRFAVASHRFALEGAGGLRLLISNAGVKQPPGEQTRFGATPTWQVNFLSPFLLTEFVARRRESIGVATGDAPALCVVQVASGRENESLLDTDLLEAAGRGERGENEYADSKRALLLWTSVRAQSLAFRGSMFVHAANPGKVDTRLGLYGLPDWLWWLSKPYRMARFRSAAEGALAIAAPGLHKHALGKFGHYSSGEEMPEDLVVWRMPDKKLSVQLVRWASQVTALEARSGGRPLSETGRPLSLTDLQSMAPPGEEDHWSSSERRMAFRGASWEI